MDILAIIITIALGVFSGRAVARFYARRGHGRAMCLFAAIPVGFLVWVITLVIAIGIIDPNAGKPANKVSAKDTTAAPPESRPESNDAAPDEPSGTVADEQSETSEEAHLPIAIDEVEGR